MKTDWNKITLSEFQEMQNIINSEIDDGKKVIMIISLLSGKTPAELKQMPLADFNILQNNLKFMQEDIQQPEIQNEYFINENKYLLKSNVEDITAAQYIDFQNYRKDEVPDMIKVLSVWLVPEGHDYGDGYDITEVWNDIAMLPIGTAMSINFFLSREYGLFMMLMTDYSMRRKLKEMEMTEDQIEEIMEPITHLNITGYFRS